MTHEPARFRRTGLGFGPKTQKNRVGAFLRGGQREAAARHEIKRLRHAGRLDHDRAQRSAGERIGRDAQGTRHIADPDKENPRRIEPQFE